MKRKLNIISFLFLLLVLQKITNQRSKILILFPPSHCPSPERELVSSQALTLKHRLQSPQGQSLNCKADIFLQNQWSQRTERN